MTLKTILYSFLFSTFFFSSNVVGVEYNQLFEIQNNGRIANNVSVRGATSLCLGIALTGFADSVYVGIPTAFYAVFCGLYDSFKCRESAFLHNGNQNKYFMKSLAYAAASSFLLIDGILDANQCDHAYFGAPFLLLAGIIDNAYG